MTSISQRLYEELESLARDKIGENWKDGLWKHTQMGFGDKRKKQLIYALTHNKNKTVEKWKQLINKTNDQ